MNGLTAADNAWVTAFVIASYFLVLMFIGYLTSRRNDNSTFFTANRDSPWYIVAFGMIGTSISGVTFISIPGRVGVDGFAYFQVVMGYFLGYLAIIKILLPLYYRMNLTSIYTYLEQRFGSVSYRTGAVYFLLSRSVGSSIRLLLAAKVFQLFIFDAWNIPFEVTVFISMALILLYSIRGGVKTIIWTDNLQTAFLVASLILTLYFIINHLGMDTKSAINFIADSPMSKMFHWDPLPKSFFWKQFLGGMFVTITMTGLDQDLMQKNLTCRSLKDAQTNMFVFSLILVAVNLLFLSLGVMLYTYAGQEGVPIPKETDNLFPVLALSHLPLSYSLVFLIGLTAATFASTDSALTALVTSYCVDILGFNKRQHDNSVRTRYRVHMAWAAIIVVQVILFYRLFGKQDIISTLLTMAGYTYGPLLGLYAFGLYTRRGLKDKLVPAVCLIAPVLTYVLQMYLPSILKIVLPQYSAYSFGPEIIVINGLISFLGLYLISERKTHAGEKKSALI